MRSVNLVLREYNVVQKKNTIYGATFDKFYRLLLI